MPKPFGPFGAGPPYARPAPPTRSFYAPCLPSKRALLQLTTDHDLLHRCSSTPGMSPLPSSHTANPLHPTHLLTLKPLLTLPQPCYPISPTPLPSSSPPPHTVTYPAYVSPERGGRTRGPHPSPRAIFMVRHEPHRRKVRIIFRKSYQIQKRIPETLPGL